MVMLLFLFPCVLVPLLALGLVSFSLYGLGWVLWHPLIALSILPWWVSVPCGILGIFVVLEVLATGGPAGHTQDYSPEPMNIILASQPEDCRCQICRNGWRSGLKKEPPPLDNPNYPRAAHWQREHPHCQSARLPPPPAACTPQSRRPSAPDVLDELPLDEPPTDDVDEPSTNPADWSTNPADWPARSSFTPTPTLAYRVGGSSRPRRWR